MNKIKTIEKMQLQDDYSVQVYDKPTDERLKDFKVGSIVTFKDRIDLITGIVGGFNMLDVEQVWIRRKDVKEHSRHRADEVKFVSIAKLSKKKASVSPKIVKTSQKRTQSVTEGVKTKKGLK